MKMKTRMISLSILALLTICLLTVAAASPSNPAAAPHSKIVTGIKTQQQTTLTLTAPTRAKLGESFSYGVSLTAGGTGVGGAIIHIQELLQGHWLTLTSHTSDSKGNYVGQLISNRIADYRVRATYDGDNQYAPGVSNEVVITIS